MYKVKREEIFSYKKMVALAESKPFHTLAGILIAVFENY